MNDHPRFQDQLNLEEAMRSMGITRFKEALDKAKKKGNESRTETVRRLMGHTHGAVVAAIEAFMAEASSGKAGVRHSAIKFLKLIDDVDVVAHLTMRSVLDSISRREKLPSAATSLSTLIEDEIHFRAFEAAAPAGFKKMHRVAEKTSSERRRRNVMLGPARKMGVELEEWSPRDKVLVGTKMIELFIAATGLARIVRVSEGASNTPYYVEATPETLEWIERENKNAEWMTPVYLPTVIPPKPWTTPFEGGYWSGRVRRLTLVKTRSRAYLNELAGRDMPVVYDAINALQDTPWAINKRVLEVMQSLWQTRSDIAKIPTQAKLEELMPERLRWLAEGMTEEDMNPAQIDEFRGWKKERARAHETVTTSKSKRISWTRMLMVANRFKDEEEFFFPHQLDWRGRIYPVTLFLHPQGNDAQRGLLEFANACPLTDDEGVQWLAIHGAGLWGVDKVSVEERVQWIMDNEEAILASARDPFENRFWADAEKPWQALAFCFDWLGWKTEGYAFESSLPVQMDGTCNGLQNFSAILRDEIGGAAVNLVPADRPQDVYSRVAEKVAKRVEADLDNHTVIKLKRKDAEGKAIEVDGPTISSIARGWYGHVNRKVTKRPVMTLAYGARRFGFIEQVFEDTVAPWKREQPAEFPFEGSGWQAADYMGKLIWDAVQEVVVAAAAAMNWLQSAASIAASQGLPVLWTTPTGFLVHQAYTLPSVKRLELTFEKVRLRLTVGAADGDGGAKIDTRKQASGISPNWVHSLDSSHMSRTIARCRDLGIRSFSFIHDSYGTHAVNAPVLARALREEFVSMYEDDVLARFRDELQGQLPEGTQLPELPPKGALDLNLVLQSTFFFM